MNITWAIDWLFITFSSKCEPDLIKWKNMLQDYSNLIEHATSNWWQNTLHGTPLEDQAWSRTHLSAVAWGTPGRSDLAQVTAKWHSEFLEGQNYWYRTHLRAVAWGTPGRSDLAQVTPKWHSALLEGQTYWHRTYLSVVAWCRPGRPGLAQNTT